MAIITESLVFDLAILVVSFISALYAYCQCKFQYWKKLGVPCVQPKFPLGNIGELILLQKSQRTLFKEQYDKLEGERYGGTYYFTKPGFIFRDPDLIKNVLIKDFSYFHDRDFKLNMDTDPLSKNVFHLRGIAWRNMRIKLTPTFTSAKMKMMYQNLMGCCYELTNTIEKLAENEEIVDMKDILSRFTTDAICSCALGIKCNCLKDPHAEFRQWGNTFVTPTLQSAVTGVLSGTLPSLLKVVKIRRTDPKTTTYFQNMVKEIVEYREKNNIQCKDFIQLLIQIKNEGKVDEEYDDDKSKDFNEMKNENYAATNRSEENASGLSMESLIANAFTFYLAGLEPTSNIATFALYELALQSDLQDRARKEIDSVLKKYGGEITYQALAEMTYLDQVIKETLRKYNPLPNLNRECTQDYKIPGTDIVLKKGTGVIIPIHAIHNDPKYYPDPDKFDPDRFTEEEKAKRHSFVYMPFGEGPRICIGMRFALMETKAGLATLLSKYQFYACSKTPVKILFNKWSISSTPVGNIWLQIKKRY